MTELVYYVDKCFVVQEANYFVVRVIENRDTYQHGHIFRNFDAAERFCERVKKAGQFDPKYWIFRQDITEANAAAEAKAYAKWVDGMNKRLREDEQERYEMMGGLVQKPRMFYNEG